MNLFTKFHNPNSRIYGYIFIYVYILTYDSIILSNIYIYWLNYKLHPLTFIKI